MFNTYGIDKRKSKGFRFLFSIFLFVSLLQYGKNETLCRG